VDYTELDAASNRGVDEIAQLLEQAVYKPVVGRFKVFMIDEVHMLTNTAFNAMLKTLEEPPEYLKFVLATTDPQKVPATVLSRCLQFNLRPMAPETVLEHLTQVLVAENIPAETQALRLLARAARGSLRDALSLTDQAISFGSGQLREASVRTMLGSVDRTYVFRLLDALARGDGRTVVETSEALRLNGLSAASTLEEMTTVLQRMAVLQAVPGMAVEDDADPEIAETTRLAHSLPADETQLLYSLCLHGRGELGLAPDEYAALTMVLLRLLAFKPSGTAVSGVQAPAVRMAAPGSAAEPEKKPQPEQPACSLVAKRVLVEPEAAPATSENNESNSALALIDIASIAINSGVTAAPSSAPIPAQALVSTPPMESSPPGETWSQMVNQLIASEAVAALTRELALQSELRSQSAGVWTLRVEHESLCQPAAREKLQIALQQVLGVAAFTLAVEIGTVTDTPARRNAAAQAERQRTAEEAIHNDPFVQDMIRSWGAKIVAGSIKPLATGPI
jgi:DNA polymerase-3 subunit gamma/tau